MSDAAEHERHEDDRHEARGSLLARAVDGELTPAERIEFERLMDEDASFREAFLEEQAAAEQADTWAGAWRLPGAGLEEAVLRRMGITPRPSWRRWIVLVAGAAAAVLVFVLWGQTEQARPTRGVSERATARFVPDGRVGASAESLGGGAYRVGEGRTRVHADGATLLETPAGVVELAPGEYDVEVRGDRVTVRVVTGEAVLRQPGGGRKVVRAGKSVQLVVGAVARTDETDQKKKGGAGAGDSDSGSDPEPDANARPVTIVGQVTDAEGRAVEGARATVNGREQATTDAGGHFRIENSFAPGALLSVVAAGFAPADARVLPLDRPAYELSIVMRNRGGALKLAIVDNDQNPIAGATIRVGGNYWNVPVTLKSPEGLRLRAAPPFALVTDGAGQVEAGGLPPQWNRLIVRAEGFAPHVAWIRVAPEVRTARTIVLRRGVVVYGSVLDPSGRGVAGVRLGIRAAGSGTVVTGVATTTDAAGNFRLVNVPARKTEVFAIDGTGRTTSTWIQGGPGTEIKWDAVLETAGVVSGVLLYDDDSPVVGARVWCRRALRGSGDRPLSLKTDAFGRFSWQRRPNALHEVTVWYPENGPAQMVPPAKRVRYLPDESPKTIVLARREAPPEPGHITGVLVTPNGAAASGAQVRAWPDGQPGWALRGIAGGDGVFKLGPMLPGKYSGEFHLDGHPTLHLRDIVVSAGVTKDLGNVALLGPGFVKGRIMFQGKIYEKGKVVVATLDRRIYYTMRRDKDDDGPYDISEGLSPGRYLVIGGAPGLEKIVEVREGETTNISLELGPGGKTRLEFMRADGTALREVKYEVFASTGRVIYSGTLDLGENSVEFWAMEDTYKVKAQDDRAKKGEAEFTVTQPKDPRVSPVVRVMLR